MSRQIIIGVNVTEIKSYFTTTIHIDGISGISEANRYFLLTSRCASDEMVDLDVFVFKASEEGKEFSSWLENSENHTVEALNKKYLQYVLPHLTVDDFIEIINKKGKKSYSKGYADAKKEIRTALGLYPESSSWDY